jgi:NADH-quinone oxidoreductase subunit C
MSDGNQEKTIEQAEQTYPLPSDPLAAASVTLLRERFPEDILQVGEHRGEVTVMVRSAAILAVAHALRDHPELRYDFLADLTAVDWPERDPRFEVVYHLLSLPTRAVLRLKVGVGGLESDDDAASGLEVPSVTGVWPTANFYEREIFDLFGIRFSGHPNMTRILMPSDWVGHPLRKDYPLTGFHLPDPHWGGQVPLSQELPMTIGQQTLRTADRTEDPPVARGPGSWWKKGQD